MKNKMSYLVGIMALMSLPSVAQESGPQPLDSEEFEKIKQSYEECVFRKGRELIHLPKVQFKDAVEFAPTACRRELLRTKKYLLDSAFKIDVIDQLVNSIEEGVRIDLVNLLIDEMHKKEKR